MITIPMWNYYYGMTLAQIELLTSDCPLVLYNTKKDKKKAPSKDDIEKAKKKWEEKYATSPSRTITLDLNGYK